MIAPGTLKQNLVLTAEPGAGKTTLIPPLLLKEFTGKILVLEPRRMAAAAAAYRVAEINGWKIGQEVGYQVRFENMTSSQTRLIYLTEALLARRLLEDPNLNGVDVVILDEFHERSIHVDLAIGLLRELQLLGRDIKILVMSATLDTAPICKFLGDAPLVSIPGRRHPLTLEYQNQAMKLQADVEFIKRVTQAIERAVNTSAGDVLVFLPGAGEIDRVQRELSTRVTLQDIDLIPLHGSLPFADQQKALKKGPRRRVVLTTNIAESSVTVDGVTVVVDSGLEKVMRRDVRTGFSRLELCRISKSSAEQRAGRAARQGPGLTVRLWSQQENAALLPQAVPEIQRIDLTDTILLLSALGINDPLSFSWFEQPNPKQILAAQSELKSLTALADSGEITNLGRRLLHWPIPPRLGRLVVEAEDLSLPALGADMASILNERDFLKSSSLAAHQADQWECDLHLRIDLLRQWRKKSSSDEVLRGPAQMVDNTSLQIRRRLGLSKDADLKESVDSERISQILIQSFPDRICRRRGSTDRGLMVGGRGVRLAELSMVKQSPFFISLSGVDLESSADTLISLASGLNENQLLKGLSSQIVSHTSVDFDEDTLKFSQVNQKIFRDLVISESSPQPAPPDLIAKQIVDVLLRKMEWLEKANPEFHRFQERWRFFVDNGGEDLTPKQIRTALEFVSFNISDLKSLATKNIVQAFESQIERTHLATFQRDLPDRIQAPSGEYHKIQYPRGRPPFAEIRIQEVFGWQQSPRVLNQKIPITLVLLGPNFRPVQTTADLASFWKSAYFEVRKELKARYPKHSWPEDPLTAKAQAKGRPRRST